MREMREAIWAIFSERDMTPTQSIELTIRAAQLIKAVSGLIGVKDEVIASFIVNEAIGSLKELADFTVKLKPSAPGKPADGSK